MNLRTKETLRILKKLVSESVPPDKCTSYGQYSENTIRSYLLKTRSIVSYLIGIILFDADVGKF